MKTIKVIVILFVVMSTILTGCQNGQSEAAIDDGANSESYPVQNTDSASKSESGYPIFLIDATQFTKVPVWVLSEYKINGQEEAHGTKTLSFLASGVYTLTTDNGTEEGHWYIETTSGPKLVMIINSDQKLSYEIIALEPESLILTLDQDGTLIEEQYQPAD